MDDNIIIQYISKHRSEEIDSKAVQLLKVPSQVGARPCSDEGHPGLLNGISETVFRQENRARTNAETIQYNSQRKVKVRTKFG